MHRTSWSLLLLVACTTSDDPRRRPDPATDTGTTPTTLTGTATGTATGTPTGGTTSATYDCTQALPAPPFASTSYPIQTQEDFDFSLGGYLVYQSGIAIVGTNKQAQEIVLSPGTAGDPRGVHGLADGRIVIMSPWDGAIKIADPYTGSLDVLAGSLNTPNGVDVESTGRIYFTTYGEVGWTEVDGSNNDIMFTWPGGVGFLSANGTVLRADEQQLTVAVPTGSTTNLVTFDRLGPDEWDEPQILADLPGFFSALDQDVCGNLYTVEYGSGDVIRVQPDGTVEVIAHLSGAGWGYSALRFGPGHSGWDRDHLYVSSRGQEVFDLTTGIPGRRHPTTP